MDVARRVGTSPATFYQYFEDLEDAALRLAERAAEEMPAIVAEIRGAVATGPQRSRARAASSTR